MSSVLTVRGILRRSFRLAWAALPLVVIAALLDGCLANASLNAAVFDPLALPAAILAGARLRGTRLPGMVVLAALGLAAANQLDPSDSYSFSNDFIFFLVVLVGGPALVGLILRRRVELVGGLSARSRRLAARSRSSLADQAAAAERGRLRGELDAVLTDRIAEIVVQASGAERTMHADPARAQEALAQIETAARSVLDELRNVLGILRVGDEDLALHPAASLEQLGDLQAAGALTLEVSGERGALDPAVDATAFRVAREAVRGASDGAAAHVHVAYAPRALRVEVAGGRFPSDSQEGIEYRVRLFGGRCRQTAEMVSLELPRRVPW